MTFKKATQLMKKLANGDYFVLQYDYTVFSDNAGSDIQIACAVYIDGYEYYRGKTWKEAIKKLKNVIKERNNPTKPKIDMNEAPK